LEDTGVGGLVEGPETLDGGCEEEGRGHGRRRELWKKKEDEDEIVDENY